MTTKLGNGQTVNRHCHFCVAVINFRCSKTALDELGLVSMKNLNEQWFFFPRTSVTLTAIVNVRVCLFVNAMLGMLFVNYFLNCVFVVAGELQETP